jgi:hypothetical protein
MKWQSDRRQTRRASLVHQSMIPMMKSSNFLRRSMKRGSKSLVHAIGTLSSALDASAEFLETKKSGHGSALLDRSLHSLLSGSTQKKLSTLSYSSSKYTSVRDPETLFSAEKVVIHARRKQSIILGIFIALQIRHKLLRGGSFSLDNSECSLDNVGMIATSKSKRNEVSVADSATTIQAVIRGCLARRDLRRARSVAVHCQSVARMRRARYAYMLLLTALCGLQASTRGFIVRKQLSKLIDTRLKLYRKHIFFMWRRECTPLAYRTNFWFLSQFNGMIQLWIAEKEIRRLWQTLSVPSSTGKETSSPCVEGTLRLPSKLYWRVLQVSVLSALTADPAKVFLTTRTALSTARGKRKCTCLGGR